MVTSHPVKRKEDVVEEFRKQAICEAAMRVVARKGMTHVTVQDIADEAGVAKGTVYIYFGSREEILATTMDDAVDKLLAKLADASRAGGTFATILERRIRTQLEHFDENRDFFRLYFAMTEPLGDRRVRKERIYATYLAQIVALVKSAEAAGEIRAPDTERVAIAMSSIIRNVVLQRMTGKTAPPIEEDVRFAVDFILRGIAV